MGAGKSTLKNEVERYLEAVRPRYAKSSLVAFRTELNRFLEYAREHGIESAAQLEESVVRDFHLWLGHTRLSESTVVMAVRALIRFSKWAYSAELCLWDGEDYRVKNPRDRSPKPPTVEVMKRLLSLPELEIPEGRRDALVLELLYVLGLRRAECCRLDLGDLDLVKETLVVRGKGGDERLLPVPPGLKELARSYLANARSKLLPAPEERALLLGDEGRRISLSGLSYVVKKYGEHLDLKLSPHQLRHACATHLVESGMELVQVQQLLGHRRLSSTRRYTQIDTRAMEREFRRCHPRARGD